MSDKKYWIVRPIINGFETCMCLYGTEEELRQYIQVMLNGVTAYAEATEDIAQMFLRLAMKVYMCPNIIQEEQKQEETEENV